MPLTDLPIELLEEILCRLGAIDLSSLRQLSRRFRALIDGSIELQLRIEAAIDGFMLHQSSKHANGGLVTRELFDALLASRRAMKVLKPPQTWRYYCRNDVAFDICDNTWAHTINSIDTGDLRGIMYVDMAVPRLKKDPESEVPTILGRTAQLDVALSDFAFLPACDLQILLEAFVFGKPGRLHLRTISTNEPHPMAARSMIELPDRNELELRKCEILVYENRIVLVFERSSHQGNITAFDWQSGKILLNYVDAIDAAFLPRDHLLLLWEGDLPYLLVYSFNERAFTHRLNLPLEQHINHAIFLTHPSDHYGSQAPPGVNSSLKPDPDNDILVLELKMVSAGYTLFVRVVISTGLVLRACTPKSEFEREWEDEGPKVLKWRQWGINATRWFPADAAPRTSIRSTYGSRMVAFGASSTFVGEENIAHSLAFPPHYLYTRAATEEKRLLMFDFNPRSVTRDAEVFEEETAVRYAYTKPSLWNGARSVHMRGRKVLSALPFRVTVSKDPWDYKRVYMNATTLIGRKDHHYDILSFLPPREVASTPI